MARNIKIISGGQTGVDQIALDAAIELGIQHGGWCPRGRRSENGIIPDRFQLQETDSGDYRVRTERNIVDSDGTLVLHLGLATGGTALTIAVAERLGKPVLAIDFSESDKIDSHVQNTKDWIDSNDICVLNVAGPRMSGAADLAPFLRPFLLEVLANV